MSSSKKNPTFNTNLNGDNLKLAITSEIPINLGDNNLSLLCNYLIMLYPTVIFFEYGLNKDKELGSAPKIEEIYTLSIKTETNILNEHIYNPKLDVDPYISVDLTGKWKYSLMRTMVLLRTVLVTLIFKYKINKITCDFSKSSIDYVI